METNIIWPLLASTLLAVFTTTIVIVSNFRSYFIYLCCVALGSFVITVSRWWLSTLEAAAVVIDKFIIIAAVLINKFISIGAHAARSCRTMTISALFARHGGACEAAETPEGVCRRLVTIAALLAAVSCQAGLSMPDGFNSMAFVASLVVVMLLMTRTVTCHGHGFCSWALRVCTAVALIGLLTGAFGIWSSRSRTSSISSALVVAILLCIDLQVLAFLRKPVENWDRNTEETLQKCSKHRDAAESEDHRDPAISDPRETVDADQHLQKSCEYLLLVAILVATITYQAGLNPPGGLWQANATDGQHHYRAGDPVLHTTYPRRYQVFFYCNAMAFMASLVILVLLVSNICRTRGIKYCAYGGLIGAYAAGRFRAKFAVDRDDRNRPIKRNNPREATWRVASAAPHHMTGNQSLLLACVHNGNDGEGIVVHPAANGEVPLRVHGSGSVWTESIALDDVWYVPGLDSNLVSTGQLARQGCAINLGPDGCRITRGGALVGTARFTEACQFELDFLKVA